MQLVLDIFAFLKKSNNREFLGSMLIYRVAVAVIVYTDMSPCFTCLCINNTQSGAM